MNRETRRPLEERRIRPALPLLAGALALLLTTSCGGGKQLKFNPAAIRSKCDVMHGVELTEQQALCIAGLAGLKNKKKCPSEISESRDPADGAAAYLIRENCSEVALWIARASGRVVAVELGDAVASGADVVREPTD